MNCADKPIVQIKRRSGVYYRSDSDTSVQSLYETFFSLAEKGFFRSSKMDNDMRAILISDAIVSYTLYTVSSLEIKNVDVDELVEETNKYIRIYMKTNEDLVLVFLKAKLSDIFRGYKREGVSEDVEKLILFYTETVIKIIKLGKE
jgi:hypothetical protein